MSARVIHTGQAIVDLVLNVPAVPKPGADIFASGYQVAAGGGFNVMAAAARDGAAVIYAGSHGSGPWGDLVRAALAAEGIKVVAGVTAEVDTGFCVAMVDGDAERTFVSTLGAEGVTSAAQYQLTQPSAADVVYTSGYSLLHEGTRDALMEWLPTLPQGAVVVADTTPVIGEVDAAVLEKVAKQVTIWSANEREVEVLAARLGVDREAEAKGGARLAGRLESAGQVEPGEEDRIGRAKHLAEAIVAATGSAVVCRLGEFGAVVASPTNGSAAVHVSAPSVRAVDTNGAGDAHCGVLCAELAAGRDLADAVARANTAAAIAVTKPGPATSPTAAEIDEFQAAH